MWRTPEVSGVKDTVAAVAIVAVAVAWYIVLDGLGRRWVARLNTLFSSLLLDMKRPGRYVRCKGGRVEIKAVTSSRNWTCQLLRIDVTTRLQICAVRSATIRAEMYWCSPRMRPSYIAENVKKSWLKDDRGDVCAVLMCLFSLWCRWTWLNGTGIWGRVWTIDQSVADDMVSNGLKSLTASDISLRRDRNAHGTRLWNVSGSPGLL